jgi:hypothetical protein
VSLKAQHGRKEPVNKFSVGQYLGREVLGQALTVQYCTAAKAEGYMYIHRIIRDHSKKAKISSSYVDFDKCSLAILVRFSRERVLLTTLCEDDILPFL